MTCVERCARSEETVRAMPSGTVPMHEGQERLQSEMTNLTREKEDLVEQAISCLVLYR